MRAGEGGEAGLASIDPHKLHVSLFLHCTIIIFGSKQFDGL